MAVLEVETRQAELLLDELKPPASEFPKGEAWERYAGALAMVESLGLSWSRDEEGRHRLGPGFVVKHKRQRKQPALFKSRLDEVITGFTPDVRLALAQREDTPAEVLEALAKDPERSVRWDVAENPCTPARALAALAKEDDKYIKRNLACNPSASPEILEALVALCETGWETLGDDGIGWILHALLENKGLAEDLRVKVMQVWHVLYAASKDGSSSTSGKLGYMFGRCTEFIAGNPDTPPSILDELAESGTARVKAAVAGNTNVTPQTLGKLIAGNNSLALDAAVRNPSVTSDMLWGAFLEGARYIGDPAALSMLGKSPSAYVRYLVAGNRSIPVETLESLLEDECAEVRKEAEFNAGYLQLRRKIALKKHSVPTLDYEQAIEHVGSGPLWDRFSRRGLSEYSWNGGSGNDGISFRSRGVLESIASSPYLPDDLRGIILTLSDASAQKGIAANPTTRKETLADLAANDDPDIRAAVARNTASDDDILRKLAGDESEQVRRAVAGNASTGADTLRLLCHDASVDVRFAIVANGWATPGYLLKMNEEDESWPQDWRRHWQRERAVSNPSLGIDVLQELMNDENETVRATAAAKETVPTSMLSKLAEDKSELVRKSVASNPNTPAETLNSLAYDRCRPVRPCARLNPSLRLMEIDNSLRPIEL